LEKPAEGRRTRSLDALLPTLYLRGISTGDFQEALSALLGKDAPNVKTRSTPTPVINRFNDLINEPICDQLRVILRATCDPMCYREKLKPADRYAGAGRGQGWPRFHGHVDFVVYSE